MPKEAMTPYEFEAMLMIESFERDEETILKLKTSEALMMAMGLKSVMR